MWLIMTAVTSTAGLVQRGGVQQTASKWNLYNSNNSYS